MTNPLWQDPRFSSTIRRPKSDSELRAYENIVASSERQAASVADPSQPMEALTARYEVERRPAINEAALGASGEGSLTAGSNTLELASWLGRASFVAFMLALGDRA